MKEKNSKKTMTCGKMKTCKMNGQILPLTELLPLLQKFGVSNFRSDLYAIKLFPAHQERDRVINAEDLAAKMKNPLMNPMTEDEVLFWSSGGSEFKDTEGKSVPVPLTGEEVHDEGAPI